MAADLSKLRELVDAAKRLAINAVDRYEEGDEVGECYFCGKRNFYGERHKAGCELQALRDAIPQTDRILDEIEKETHDGH